LELFLEAVLIELSMPKKNTPLKPLLYISSTLFTKRRRYRALLRKELELMNSFDT
jgi:hypothetical protein